PSAADVRRRAVARWWRQLSQALRRLRRVQIGLTAIAVLAAIAAATWLAVKRGWLPGAARTLPTIAVLPFRNETDAPEDTRYIADGLAEALATNLAQTERLRTLPWVTTERVKPDSVPLVDIARDLRARSLLLGTLRSSPSGLAVSLSIVDG